MKKALIIGVGLVLATSLNAQWGSPMGFNSSSSSSNGYKGKSGQTYQYDSTKYEDKVKYQYDYNAQQRDKTYNTHRSYNPYNNRAKDQKNGQYGMGIYGN